MLWTSIWILHSPQKTGGLFNTIQEFEDSAVIGSVCEMPMKSDLMDNPLTADDLLDGLFSDNFDYSDVFSDNANVLENSDVDKQDSSVNVAINYSEIMADLVNLMSLDRALALQENADELTTNEAFEVVCQKNGKRLHDDVIDDDITDDTSALSPISDHNYSSVNQKRQKLDDTLTLDTTPQPLIVKTTKYLERRKKNNVASKRSRETRKNRFLEMEVQADQLEMENEKLRDRITKLENLTQQMKEILVSKLAKSR